jgi:hypothetical protein
MKRALYLLTAATLLAGAGCGKTSEQAPPPGGLDSKIARFTPTVITGDTSSLSGGDRKALHKLIEAVSSVDRLYLRQAWMGNEALLGSLSGDRSAQGRLKYRYFLINMGPWSELDHNEPFLEGVPARPPQANYYPDTMTKEEFNTWIAKLPEAEQKQATGFFTTIRRDAPGTLKIVPYSVEYADLLQSLARTLKEAAALTTNTSLREFLSSRADAFLSNDYYASDVAWLNLDSPIDVTIGPYEVYMDDLFNYKAAFEAYITLRNDEETKKLSFFSTHLQEIEDNLPIDPEYRNPKLGALSPIRVVDEVAIGGEAKAGVQTAAFNLPNDERVIAEHGSKRVMLKNVQEAKFKNVLVPIARRALDSTQLSLVSFDPFFTHILAHELMHGLGPHTITVGGKATTVRQAMRELSSALEEAKADISGLFALQFMIDRGLISRATEHEMYATFLAGVFRSVRFGITEAHGRGIALQFNYLLEKKAFSYNEKTGTFAVDFAAIKPAVRELTSLIMTIQAEGNYERAKQLLDHYAVLRPEMKHVLDGLTGIPVDIAPSFPLAG